MKEGSPLLRGAGVVALALVLMECGYRLVYWYWMRIADPAQRQVVQEHFHFWLGAVVVVGLSWMYLVWKTLSEERKSAKPKIMKKTPQ